MRHRIARTVFPCGLSSDPVVVVSTWRVPVPAARPSIYHTVDFVERLLFRGRCGSLKRIEERIPLRSIVALHNVDGIRDVAQIKAMLRQIRAGGDVLHSTGSGFCSTDTTPCWPTWARARTTSTRYPT
jgi:hypothetical protein